MHPRVLIVGTVPYNPKMTSRAFKAYFSFWEKENLAQVFSNPQEPIKGHCGRLYQITDARLLKKALGKKLSVGKRYVYEDLSDSPAQDTTKERKRGIIPFLYKIGSRKNSFSCLMRKWLWKKSRWCTDDFNSWLDDFSPECVFLSFSDDFFIPTIALYVAERFDIPIVSSIGDDYYFNHRFSLNPFYFLYRGLYKKLIRSVFAHGGSAIYISDKIRDKYNSEFALDGKTVYLCSEIERREFRPVNTENPSVCYFGNIRQGRNESLSDIAYALGRINPSYRLTVCSGQNDRDIVKVLTDNPFIDFLGAIPYEEVKKRSADADVLVIVEGFKKKHINYTRYSLSTKAADSLASGAAILVYGSRECGVIEYMRSTEAATVCTNKDQLEESIRKLFFDVAYQKVLCDKAKIISEKNHREESCNAACESVITEVVESYAKSNYV